jgi:glycine/D-amino acid oxidase-like deaminating enzyme
MGSLQSSLRAGPPIWLPARTEALARYPQLTGHHRADVAIVGGGITGALVACTFASAGVSVVLLESGLVGRGSTAASSGLLLREPDVRLADLTRRYGPVVSRRIWQLCHDGVRDFVALLHRLRIPCGLEPQPAVHVARTMSAADELERELAQRRSAGFGGRWLGETAIRRLTGVSSPGGIGSAGQAQLDPYRACLGLMRAAVNSGARIFERSEVTRVRRRDSGVRMLTAAGTVDASRVIVATGYATPRFRPLRARFKMHRTYVLVTEPLGPAARRRIGFGRMMFWDTGQPYHYARWTTGHRLLIGGGDRPLETRSQAAEFCRATNALREDFLCLWPPLADVRIDAAWEGLFAQTPDSLPYIGSHRRYPGHLFALGYGGNGMTFGYLAAKLLLDDWHGSSGDLKLFGFSRHR